MWADRVGNAYGWGYLSPLTPRRLTGETDTLIPPNVFGAYRGNAANPRRTIPDNNLGWEIDAGFDWKILEGFNINATFGYWQPGKWFNYACVDRGVPGWDTLSQVGAGQGTLYWGVNPNRSIDPIWGMEFKLVGEF
jgi:hypothetical protein